MLPFMTAPVMAATIRAMMALIMTLFSLFAKIRKLKSAKMAAKTPATHAASFNLETGRSPIILPLWPFMANWYTLPSKLELRSHTGSIP